MSLHLKELFNQHNGIPTVDESIYVEKAEEIRLAEGFARSFYQPVVVIDLYKRNAIFVSANMKKMLGLVLEQDNIAIDSRICDFLPEEDDETHIEIINNTFELLYSFPEEERLEWSLSYNFVIGNGRKSRLIHLKITPLNLTPDGKVWLVMCSFSLSSRKEPWNPTLRHFQHLDYYYYSLKKHRWYYKEGEDLTDIEKEILILSSQGYIMKEIAEKLGKSESAVKFYKRQLFDKTGAKNITEAVFTALNDNLLH